MKVSREKAKELIAGCVATLGWETVSLERACGRVVAEDIVSPVDVPDKDLSAVDGYAFTAGKHLKVPFKLNIVGEVPAGSEATKTLREGEATLVMTGAPLPPGANAVVRLEDVKVHGNQVVVDFPVERGNLVNFKGCDIQKGEVILKKGERLDWRKIGLLAHAGVFQVKVFRKPRVALIPTGNEIGEPFETQKGTKNSGFWSIRHLLESEGAECFYMGVVPDDAEKVKEAVENATELADIVVTLGGVSRGKYDIVKKIIPLTAFTVKFTETNIRPGKPLLFATYGKKLFFGLPGYPSASVVNALEFLVPAVRKMAGRTNWKNTYITAFAGEPLKSRRGRVDFVRVLLFEEDGRLKVKGAGSQRTGVFKTTATCDGFAVLGEDRETALPGEKVEFLPAR